MTDSPITLAEARRRKAEQETKTTPEKPAEENDEVGSSQRDKLIACAAAADLWHDADGTGYATLAVTAHAEHYLLRSKGFRLWLGYQYYLTFTGAPGAQAMQDAISALEAQARFEGEQHELAVRVALHEGNIYVDLADDDWRAIEVTPRGWSVVSRPPVRFVRPRGLRPLPTPTADGTMQDLARFLNVRTEGDLKLVLGWLVMAFNPRGPYPILVLNGKQGSAKSTAARILRSIIDPSQAPLRSPPREERDLLVAARNSWIIAFDNLSGVKEWLADALCRIATGGGSSARQLYTDSEEVIFEAMRPVVLNGIPDLATRPDLADRAIILKLPNIDETKRRTEAKLWAEFDEASGRILGFLLNAVSTALDRRDKVQIKLVPRMGDFGIWGEAAGPAFGWNPGQFTEAYQANRDTAVSMTVTAEVVAEAIRTMVDEEKVWQGTASELFDKLNLRVSDQTRRSDQWPKAANALSNRLRRAAPGLRAMGLEVIEHDRTRPRQWELRISPQKINIIDKTDIFNVTKAFDPVDPVDPIEKTDAKKASKSASSVDPVDDVDDLQAYSSPDHDPDGALEERAAIQEWDG